MYCSIATRLKNEKYCNPPFKDIAGNPFLHIDIFVSSDGTLIFKYFDEKVDKSFCGVRKFNFCPMCGRKFAEEK